MNAPVYVEIDQGILKVKLRNARNEKQKKLCGFSFSINMANFEAFTTENFEIVKTYNQTLY